MQLQALEPLFKIFYTFLFLPTKISREKLQTNIWKIESKGLVKFKHRSTKFVSKILCCVALVYLLFYFILFIIIFFFSAQAFYGNYATLDAHTNTVNSHAVGYSSRWHRKPR